MAKLAEKEMHSEIRAQVKELLDEIYNTVEEAKERGKKQPIRFDLPVMFQIQQISQKDLQREIYSMLIAALEKEYGLGVKIAISGNKIADQQAYLLLTWTSEVEVRTRDAQDAFLRAHMISPTEVVVKKTITKK